MRGRIYDRAVEKILEVLVPEIGDPIIEVMEVLDERFTEERRRHIFVECTQLRKLEAREDKILVIKADFMDVRRVTELKHFSLHMKPAIHRFYAHVLGANARHSRGLWLQASRSFWRKIELPANAGYIKRSITSGMLGNVQASKIHAGLDTEKVHDGEKYRGVDEGNRIRSMPMKQDARGSSSTEANSSRQCRGEERRGREKG